jgi:hypothetical protein
MRRAVGFGVGLVFGGVVSACSSGSTTVEVLADASTKASMGLPGMAGSSGAMGQTGSSGASGAMGAMGLPGKSNDAGPAISAITPPYAFTGRTVDVTISGSGTTWSASALPTVKFANAGIAVGTVTVPSPASLIVKIAVADTAALGPTDVTVTSGASTIEYSGGFQVQAPLAVITTPDGGVPQGGYGNLHIEMNDLTTPFDPDTFSLTLSAPGLNDLSAGQFAPTDYACDVTVIADVTASVGASDVTVMSGEPTTITSLGTGLVQIAARAPTVLAAGGTETGNIETEVSTELYQFSAASPASGQVEFIQFTVSSEAGILNGAVMPKSGMWADPNIAYFAVRNGQCYGASCTGPVTPATDPVYVIILDSDNPFEGPGPTPADSTLVSFQAAASPATEETETGGANNDTQAHAEAITPPVLVSATLGYGAVAASDDLDFYAIGNVAAAKTIHAATGGDANDATIITIYDSTGTQVAQSPGDDNQQDLVFAVTTAGAYFVMVQPDGETLFGGAPGAQLFDTTGVADYGDSNYNTYDLFVAIE